LYNENINVNEPLADKTRVVIVLLGGWFLFLGETG
jgi:hypothetical protein